MVLLGLLGLMVVASITTYKAQNGWYVLVSFFWTGIFLQFGRSVANLSWADMGMHRWGQGLVWGGTCILIVTIAMAAGVAIPRLHPLFADERVFAVSGSQIAHKALVEVPIGTVLLEEVVFRGVLMGLMTVQYGWIWGLVGTSLVFGFWHVLPALEMHGAHALASKLGEGWRGAVTTVLGTVLATGLAGIGFGLLRLGSGCILAPMGLHWATNSTGSIAAWLVAKRQGPTEDLLDEDEETGGQPLG
jgi:membrane protease YdiL (CAAX protease family)